ncbi:MAG TPA: O-antigen ligase family protein [Solirubrobacteraceae bacterium]|nr:O-antigen ligase family protein [Solirubrobacteraceae bacterium]
MTSALATSLPSASTILVALVGGGALVTVLVLAMRRWSEAFPLLALLALPFRLPISADGRTVNLLIPLYLVVVAGTLEHLSRRLAGAGAGATRPGGGGEAARSPRTLSFWTSPRGLEWLLFASVALYALQTIYSSDHTRGIENVAAFYIPFALLFLLLREVEWTRELLLRCLGVAVALAVVFAGIGFVEYARKDLFLNPKVVAANQYDNYFRVNSLFFDPSIYGRFLALVMIALTTVVLWSTRRRDTLLGGAILAWLLAGLATSFSQSSLAALLLGLAVLAAWRWDVRATVAVAAVLVACAGAIVLLAPTSLHFGLKGSGGSTSNATSGRTALISGGLELFAKRPLEGYGSGSFEVQYKRHGGGTSENATSASHTIPVTVAAEQGVLGLAMYVALLIVAFLVLLRDAGRSPSPKPGDTRLPLASPFRPALAACFAALVLHTWTYADFLEDPFTWAILAVGVNLARQDGRWASEARTQGAWRAPHASD